MPRLALSKTKIHVTCRLPLDIAHWIENQEDDRTTVITKAIEQYRDKSEKNNYARTLRQLKRDRDNRETK
jgi:hypothetical protein